MTWETRSPPRFTFAISLPTTASGWSSSPTPGTRVSENLERAIRRVVIEAGFTQFRRAAETRFNLVYDVRP